MVDYFEGLHTVEPFPVLLLQKRSGRLSNRIHLNSFAKPLIRNIYADFVKEFTLSIGLQNLAEHVMLPFALSGLMKNCFVDIHILSVVISKILRLYSCMQETDCSILNAGELFV